MTNSRIQVCLKFPGRPLKFRSMSSLFLADSEISDDDDDGLPGSETIGDRIYALRDMIAPSTRRKISSNVSTAGQWTWGGLRFGGKAFFVVVTSVLFYGIPFALSVVEETNILEMEKEEKMREAGAKVCHTLMDTVSIGSMALSRECN